MNSGMNRWLVSGTWLAAVLALISASTKGAIGVGAMWSLPAAIGVTLAAMGWPDKQSSRIIAALGVVWQVALIGAYWPFTAAEADPNNVAGPMRWSMHSIAILVVLMLLMMSFVALYVLPALGLMGRIKKAARAVVTRQPNALEQVEQIFAKDPGLTSLWQEYIGQVRPANSQNALQADSSHSSARDLFDANTVAHTRLRLDFFRNLPGVFTGIGIIGTFGGLISGLRAFQISQDPAVVQRSLEALLTGVWGAFLISALAIAMAILVTVVEKLVASALSHHLDVFAAGLDGLFPPRPQTETEDWVPRLIEALGRFSAAAPASHTAVPAASHTSTLVTGDGNPSQAPAHTLAAAMVPMSADPTQPQPAGFEAAMHTGAHHLAGHGPSMQPPSAMHAPSHSPEMSSQMLDLAQTTRNATMALADIASRIPDMLAGSLQGANQNHQQASQAMRALSGKLEGVASSIEFSARKTLETVAARLMQSEMNMVSRHHAVADHLGELVQRIEALCGLLQQDRADMSRGMGASDPFGYDSGAGSRTGGGLHGYAAAQNHYGGGQEQFAGGGYSNGHRNGNGNGNGNGYAQGPDNGNGYGQMAGEESWEEPAPDAGGFGR
jgi:MotA/TolQ/ExbB proton channel family